MHYEAMAEFFAELPPAFIESAKKDTELDRLKIASIQSRMAEELLFARDLSSALWQISKPHMYK